MKFYCILSSAWGLEGVIYTNKIIIANDHHLEWYCYNKNYCDVVIAIAITVIAGLVAT